ncbi:S8 family serine peptidase [Kitasatospora sp. NPDC057223]|uniref:S8 family serine peptidase n=1 Tax=Kitasatospora sp. NPDC057223 TaxID=3346055 RepID=UPI0036267E4F
MAAAPAAAVDSIREQQWHLDAMKAPEIWQTTKGAGVTVAVIDGGFKLDHPDLVGQLLPGKDFSGLPGGLGEGAIGHGTGIAGLIAGSGKGLGGKGAYGLAPGSKLLPIKTLSGSNSTSVVSGSEFLRQIDQAIIYAADQGAKVINISQAGDAAGFSAADIADLKAAVAHAGSKGSLVIAGAGNSAQKGNPVQYPAALPTVVAVGAVGRDGMVIDESERGKQIDLVAPGMDMYDPCSEASGYCKTRGTSDATAIVSASAALVFSAHPDWSPNQVLRVLINTAGKPSSGAARTDEVGFGVVRPRIALTTPGDPGPADVSPLDGQQGSDPVPSPAASAPAGDPTKGATTPAESPAAGAPATNAAPSEGSDAVTVPGSQTADGNDSGSTNTVWIIGGGAIGAAVLIGVVVAIVAARRRSAASAAAVAAPVPMPVGAPQGYPGAPRPPYGQQPPPQYGQQAPYGQQPPAPPQYGAPADPPSDNPYSR